MSATFDITIKDNSGIVKQQLNAAIRTALEAVGVQAESHSKQIITDTNVYGGIDLKVKAGEKDNSRVDTGQLRNSVTHTVIDTDVYIGSNLQHAVWNEIGTGIYASQPGGRQSPWVYVDRHGVGHRTRGLYPIHFLKKAASEYIEEYKRIFETTLAKIS